MTFITIPAFPLFPTFDYFIGVLFSAEMPTY